MAGPVWHDGGIASAFELARERGQRLFLYWGAPWCPPCNRIKGDLFLRADLAALSACCVALQVDGDGALAQQLAQRYHLRSYPTLVVYRADGVEVTRLPNEVDGARCMRLLGLALAAGYTVAESLEAALAGTRGLDQAEWELLAWYSWDTDEQQVLAGRDAAGVHAALALACPDGDAALRFEWQAVLAGARPDGAAARLRRALQDARVVRAQMDLLANHAVALVKALQADDSGLAGLYAAALVPLETDPGLNPSDRLFALRVRLRLGRLGAPAPERELVRQRAADAARDVEEPAMRHSVVNTAAGVLSEAGLADEAEALLREELERSHAPYYFMHNLAAIAKRRGDAAGALAWYEQAWRRAEGPATRLQWGATFLQALADLAPQDAARMEQAACRFLAEIAAVDDAHCQRNRTQLQRLAARHRANEIGGRPRFHLALQEIVGRQ